MGTRRVARIGGGLVAGAALVLVACSSTVEDADQEPVLVDPTAEATEPVAPPSSDPADAKYPLPVLGTWHGHFDGRSITFTPVDEAAKNSPIQPQGFGSLPMSTFEFTTADAIVVNNGGSPNPAGDAAQCTANRTANPTKYFTSGTHNIGGSACANKHLCATVNLKNVSARTIDKVWVETSNFYTYTAPATTGFRGDNSATEFNLFNQNGYPPNHGLNNATGLWGYGSIDPNTTSNTVRWDFYLPSCQEFDWTTTVKGVARASDYTQTGPTQKTFIDACSGGTTVHATGTSASAVSNSIAMQFPFSFYGQVFGSTNVFGGWCDIPFLGPLLCNNFGSTDGIRIGANGVIGLIPGTVTANASLPNAAVEYTMMPFWDAVNPINMSGSGAVDGRVCYRHTGTAPNRKFVATWRDVTTSGNTARLTFSAVLEEGSDAIEFQYLRFSNSRSACNVVSSASRGGSATFGLQGSNSAAGVHAGSTYNTPFLTNPADATNGCPTNAVVYRFTPNVSL